MTGRVLAAQLAYEVERDRHDTKNAVLQYTSRRSCHGAATQSDQAGWIKEFGYPAYVVPVVNSVWRGDTAKSAGGSP